MCKTLKKFEAYFSVKYQEVVRLVHRCSKNSAKKNSICWKIRKYEEI